MRIDVSDLQQLWFEDENGARFVPDLTGEMPPVKPSGFIHLHSRFVNRLTESVETEVTAEAVAACSHSEDMVSTTKTLNGESQFCLGCGGRRPLVAGAEWSHGHNRTTYASSYSWSPDLVLAMTRPTESERALQRERWNREKPALIIGNSVSNHQPPLTAPNLFGLEEAIIISATSCERCMNALYWMYGVKFSEDDQGFPEMSAGWKSSGTSCRFCRHMGFIRSPPTDSELTPVTGVILTDDDNPF